MESVISAPVSAALCALPHPENDTMNDNPYKIPELHDGRLIGVLSFDEEAVIQAKSAEGRPWTLLLKGVLRLRVRDMYEGNIIFDCVVVEASRDAEEALEELIQGPDRGAEMQRLKNKLDDGSHRLVVINPSYGATVVAIAQFVEVLSGFVSLSE